ncbi:MAG: peptidyl-prolyl cis-trans isomerase [Gammaproteobacteria bacterium]|nr:peptidyl-prolyl cis-trans isomerase [Gammaproteobacteria bacterium]
MRRLLREPLFHFLLLGAVLFFVFDFNQEETTPSSSRRIVVTTVQVEQLAAYFSRIWLRPPTRHELDEMIERHIRNEIYYREARAMGLDQNDPYIRNRLALKLSFILDDLSARMEPPEDELARFAEQNVGRFSEPARLSFRQVYVNPEKHANPAAEAQHLLEQLRDGIPPEGLGDAGMLATQVEEASWDETTRLFGEKFTLTLMDIETGTWQGPLLSPFGIHLVHLTKRQSARQPALEDIREAVLAEWQDQRRRESKEAAYQHLRVRYEIIIEGDGDAGALPGKSTLVGEEAAPVEPVEKTLDNSTTANL